MTTSVTYSVRNGILVQDGLDPTPKVPGPGICINCGQYLEHLSNHYSNYFGYFCQPIFNPNGSDPRPYQSVPSTPQAFGSDSFGAGTFGAG